MRAAKISFKSLFKADTAVCLASLGLIILGISSLSSVSAVFSMEKFGSPDYLLKHQLLFGFIPGLFLGLGGFFFPLEKLKKLAPIIFLITIFGLAALFVSRLGLKFLGASRWLNLGLVTLQPSEFLKLALVLYLAAWFSKYDTKASKIMPFFVFFAVILVVSVLLISQPDIGTLGIVAITGLTIFFLAGTPIWQNLLIVFSGLGGLALLIKFAPYRLSRWLVFLNPNADPMGKGYQLKQSLIAIGSGGIFGLGFGMSRQKFGFLPQTIGDAIFPIFAEETGFLGTVTLVLLFLIFIWQGLKIAKLAKTKFSQLAAAGICAWLGFQALINICSMTGLLPLTGVPLPFVSYGGSHLVSELGALGILLNISKQ